MWTKTYYRGGTAHNSLRSEDPKFEFGSTNPKIKDFPEVSEDMY